MTFYLCSCIQFSYKLIMLLIWIGKYIWYKLYIIYYARQIDAWNILNRTFHQFLKVNIICSSWVNPFWLSLNLCDVFTNANFFQKLESLVLRFGRWVHSMFILQRTQKANFLKPKAPMQLVQSRLFKFLGLSSIYILF